MSENFDQLPGFMVKISKVMKQIDSFCDLLDTHHDEWDLNTESIISELKSLKNSFVFILETVKSTAHQQIVHVENIQNQFRIIGNIVEDAAGGQLAESHLKSIDFARNRITTSLNEIHKIGSNLNEYTKSNQTIISLQENLLDLKSKPNLTSKQLVREYLHNNHVELTILGGMLGALIGTTSGATILFMNASTGTVLVLGSVIFPFFVISIPLVIGAITLGGLAFGAIKFVKHKFSDDRADLNEFQRAFSKFKASLDELRNYEKEIEKFERDFLFNVQKLEWFLKNEQTNEGYSNVLLDQSIKSCDTFKQTLSNFINFKYSP